MAGGARNEMVDGPGETNPNGASRNQAGRNDTDDLIGGPRWRVRTTPARRHVLAVVSFASIVLLGVIMMGVLMRLLGGSGASGVVVLLPWLVPTVAMMVWVLSGAHPADATDEHEQSWPGYAIRYVLVGEDTPRALPARIVATLLFGGPAGWPVVLLGCAILLGLF